MAGERERGEKLLNVLLKLNSSSPHCCSPCTLKGERGEGEKKKKAHYNTVQIEGASLNFRVYFTFQLESAFVQIFKVTAQVKLL